MNQPIQRYRPAGARAVTSKESSAVCYVYERAGAFYAMGYCFKRGKSEFHFRYRTEAERNKKVEIFMKAIVAAEIYKAQQAAEKKAKRAQPHNVKVGQVFVSSWGYDQTNVDYYEVVALKGRCSALVVAIAGDTLEGSEGSLCGQSIPSMDPDRTAGKVPFVAQIKEGRIVSRKIYGRGGASAWEGKPKYWSAYA